MELKKIKRMGIIILVLALILLVSTNYEPVEITLFFWSPEIPLFLLIVLAIMIGFVLGLFAALNVGKEKKPEPADQSEAQPGTQPEQAASERAAKSQPVDNK